ncbi:terpenoid synthase [Aspergillus californicus]
MSSDANQQALRREIEGRRVEVPDLFDLLPQTDIKLHPDYAKARDEVLNPWIRRWVDNDETCAQLQSDDLGIFAAVVCAEAPYDKFCTVAKFFTWHYLWGDIFDLDTLKNESTHRVSDNRRVSIEYIQHQLVPKNEGPDLSSYPLQLQKALQAWDEIGVHIRSVCGQETVEILLKALVVYMASVGAVNALLVDGKRPTIHEYWVRRDRDAGIYPGIAIITFAAGVDITRADIAHPQVMKLWRHTSFSCHIMNDMISLKKELDDGHIDNLIPVMILSEGLTIDKALQKAYDVAAHHTGIVPSISQDFFDDDDASPGQKAFAAGCLGLLAGLVQWSYTGGRYLEGGELGDDHVFRFTVERRPSV